MRHSGGAQVTRRALLGSAAAAGLAAAGCSSAPRKPAAPAPPDPQTVLLTSLIAGKEQLVSLYGRAVAALPARTAALEPFRQRHAAHLQALRALLPAGSGTGTFPASPAPASSSASPSERPSAVSVEALRDAERRAASARPAQMATASPALAQLLASIGACEAVHVVALGRVRD
ncbi:hypothetical protein [Microbispora catharanthi]|uniref:DUF4439 domain-containing protein n=1 Tax=Microbispora catharanthi TaxID=1712871 RepID=A0A5N6BSS0_9ACTN|nr:hypothetical protein [Microbispora catharanthi]KAB8183400.1 hypothetical protein FH610_020065 [Microbispora catharanthi]